MGRDAGDTALNAGIGAGAEEILIPEQNPGKERLVSSLKRSKKSGKSSSIVVVAEGVKAVKIFLSSRIMFEETWMTTKLR